MSSSENDTENDTEKQLIINLMSKNKDITISQISKAISLSRITIVREIDKLKQIWKIKRIGPNKGGYWEVIK